MLLLVTLLLQHPLILCACSSQLLPLVNLNEKCAGTGAVCMCRHVCTQHRKIVVNQPLSLWGSHQRASAAAPVIRGQRLLYEAMGWRVEKWHGTIFFFFSHDSGAWISWTRSLKAAGNVFFRCLIYFLCKRKVWTVFITEWVEFWVASCQAWEQLWHWWVTLPP